MFWGYALDLSFYGCVGDEFPFVSPSSGDDRRVDWIFLAVPIVSCLGWGCSPTKDRLAPLVALRRPLGIFGLSVGLGSLQGTATSG